MVRAAAAVWIGARRGSSQHLVQGRQGVADVVAAVVEVHGEAGGANARGDDHAALGERGGDGLAVVAGEAGGDDAGPGGRVAGGEQGGGRPWGRPPRGATGPAGVGGLPASAP